MEVKANSRDSRTLLRRWFSELRRARGAYRKSQAQLQLALRDMGALDDTCDDDTVAAARVAESCYAEYQRILAIFTQLATTGPTAAEDAKVQR
ncbi:MAG TPA: hypothetical protein VG675_17715 [Bryobacteraceae bacterium]|nr:hypothetical protein [Bryobacteraceae bacterium]